MTKIMYAHLYTWNPGMSVKTPCFLQMWTFPPLKVENIEFVYMDKNQYI